MGLTAYEQKCIDRTAEELIASSVDGIFIDDEVKELLDSLDGIDIKAIVITPGGRVGNDSPFSRSRTSNWVARTGGLPKYVREVARGLMKKGKTESEAIHLAIGILKNWASGKGNVSAKVRAAAAKAIAQWEAMRTANRAKKATRASKNSSNKKSLWDHPDNGPESKESGMSIEYKDIEVKGLTIDDEDQGIVTAIVSVTGLVDNVKDNIHPGAYNKTLSQRTPKGVWGHDWNTPVSKTLQAKELMPGDPELPETQPNGEPWPTTAGALKIQTQFNLKTQMGRDAFENVKFYGPDQQWSIGYKVPVGGAFTDTKTGIREIETLELYEYSPVLFGAMSLAGTQSVKSAQIAWAEEILQEAKDIDDDDLYFKKKFTSAQRDKLAKRGVAMSDGGYPIESESDLHNAVSDYNRTGQDPKVKAHIKKRAKALGLTDKLPDSFGGKKDLDLSPYDDVDGEDEDENTDDGSVATIQISSRDISLLYTCIDHMKNLMETITGVSDDEDDDDDRGAVDEEDMTEKTFEPYTEYKEAQNLSALVDELLDYKDDIGNMDELSDYAEQFDDQLGSDDIDGAMNTASDFVKALETAAENASEQDTASAIESVATDFAEILQDVADENGDDEDDEEDTEGSDDEGDSGSKSDPVVVELKDLQELMSFS